MPAADIDQEERGGRDPRVKRGRVNRKMFRDSGFIHISRKHFVVTTVPCIAVVIHWRDTTRQEMGKPR
jgi:hypothetical protein